MRKQFWIMVKQFLLYLLLDQGVAVLLMIPLVIYGVIQGYKGEAMQDLLTTSSGALCVMMICSILTITVFLKKRYVRLRPGRIARSSWTKAAGYAMLIAWGWMFTEAAALQLIGFDKLFPEENEHFDMMTKMFSNPLGLIAGGVLAPITEEIVFRGVLVGGMLRMRQKPWVAIVLSALVFALFHGTYTQFVGTTIFGIICGWLYWRTKSLLPGILVHVVNNSTAFGIAAFSDDPNADLPTKLCLLFLIIFPPMLAIGLKWYKQKKYLITFLLALITITGQAQKNNYTVSGDLSVLTSKMSVPVKAISVSILNDSTMIIPPGKKEEKYDVKDGKFLISGNVSRPYYSNLMVELEMENNGEKRRYYQNIPFILEPGNIVTDKQWVILGGTPLNDISIETCTKLNEIAEAGAYEKLKQEAFSFINLPADQQSAVEHFLQVHSWPTYKLIDRDGKVLDVNADPRDLENLAKLLDLMK